MELEKTPIMGSGAGERDVSGERLYLCGDYYFAMEQI